ncbi:MAG: site-specific integrase [Planctomycetaceae bacterium]|nr:site-specific integrase [Planctomycetaceae bacterium]
MHYILEPEVAGSLGQNTIIEDSLHPPVVLNCTTALMVGQGDDLLESFPCYIVTDKLRKLIAKMGKAAGIKVAATTTGKLKYASAHDLRRAFGLRWSKLIMPAELKELMRHREISTTMQFYVGEDAKATIKRLRQVVANTLANIPLNQASGNIASQSQVVTGE